MSRIARALGAVLIAVLSLLALSVPTASATGGAGSLEDCQAKISALRAKTAAAAFIGPDAEKDRAGLIARLDAAAAALTAGKTADAIGKLTDFLTKVEELNDQGKISPADADTLIVGVSDAIACVQTLTLNST